jgi:uncharacterized Zn finger protein
MARYDDGWPAYVPVAERRRQAEREVARLRRKGQVPVPVRIEGRAIATTAWGKAWCDNLERYRDYDSRLPRGRTYTRNGSVIDLQIAPREVTALVSGSEIYKVKVAITPLPAAKWRAICADCVGRIESLVELLQGRLSAGVMERLCRQDTGLFPMPSEIRFSCTCLDHAVMCKHVAAVLYGVGARLDSSPELLFRLRAVEAEELLAGLDEALPAAASPGERVLTDHDISALFGLDMTGLGDQDSGVRAEVGEGRLPGSRTGSSALTASPPRKPTTGRSRAMPRKKTAPTASSKTRQDVPPDRSRTAGRSPVTAVAGVRKAAAQQAKPDPRAAKAGGASGHAGQAAPARRAAETAPAAIDSAAPRQRSRARLQAAQGEPVSAKAGEPGAAQMLEAVLAQLAEIGRSLGEVTQLRADVQRLNRRLDEIATAVAGQGRGRASTEATPPATHSGEAEPTGTPRKQRASQARRPARSGGTSA